MQKSGQVCVHRIVAAVDCGTVVNPSGAEAQVQDGILFALSAAMKQEITVEKGQTVQSNFDTYDVVRMEEAPKIEVHFVPGSMPPHGMGEGAVGQTAPAVTEAIFQATGKRIRRLPIRSS
jgi:isoquinoline 1-oxidoreductase beta subunit